MDTFPVPYKYHHDADAYCVLQNIIFEQNTGNRQQDAMLPS